MEIRGEGFDVMRTVKDMSPPPGYQKYHLASFLSLSTFASLSCFCLGPRLDLPDSHISQVLPPSVGPRILPAQTKTPECALHCEDSQLLKHHSCTVAEDTAGKVPRHWIPPLPQKPQTLHIMPAIERKRREERRRRGTARRGRDEKRRK